MKKINTCWQCKHFCFEAGSPGYSEYTPGTDAYISCAKDKFERWNMNDLSSQREFADVLSTAETCNEFTEYEKEQ